VPCRPAVYAPDYQAACEINRGLTGKALSKQAWNLCPKIREVDRYLRGRAAVGPPLRESHPELCFSALAGGRPMHHSKRTEAGRAERLALLEPWVPEAASLVADLLTRHGRGRLASDDVLDALVLAVVASMPDEGLETIPGSIEHDAEGLPQEMVVPSVPGAEDPGGTGFAEALASHYAAFVAAYEAGDAAALASLYTDDAALLEPDKPPIRGRETILRDLEAWFGGFSFSNGRFETWELEVLGDTAWDLSYFEMEALRRETGERFGERWKQLCIWKRADDGIWRLHRLMYNRHRPPSTP
jgi:ketosteroid isomerase-like protein